MLVNWYIVPYLLYICLHHIAILFFKKAVSYQENGYRIIGADVPIYGMARMVL